MSLRIDTTFNCPVCVWPTCRVSALFIIAQARTQSVPAIPAHFDDVDASKECECDVDPELLERDAREALEECMLGNHDGVTTSPPPSYGDEGLIW